MGVESLVNSFDELFGGDVGRSFGLTQDQCQVLGHDFVFLDGVDGSVFDQLGELDDVWGVVELTSLD